MQGHTQTHAEEDLVMLHLHFGEGSEEVLVLGADDCRYATLLLPHSF